MFLQHGVKWTEFFVIFGPFFALLPLPLKTQKIKILKKKKKAPEDVIILHKCTKNNDHMMYASWDMEYKRQNFLSFWAILCPFPPQNQTFKKTKKTSGEIIHLCMCTINEDHIMYGSWDIEIKGATDRISCYFGTFFCPFTPLTTWKIKILKKWKKAH